MAAFERIPSGIPEMDQAVDNLRLGDNVVWQVTGLREFSMFVRPFVQQCLKDGRRVIYVRFAAHEPLVPEGIGVEVMHVELSHRFEKFTVEIHNLIEQAGEEVMYVFDCLSELQVAWSTDLMMGNFFRVTCPFLFQLNTVAYFPLIRGKHSFSAIAKIRDTTQVLMDVYSEEENTYVRPLKMWNRYSETMFLPHLYKQEQGTFRPLMDGVQISRFYHLMNLAQSGQADQNVDSWDRFFSMARQMNAQNLDMRDVCTRMCIMMMTRDKKLRELVKQNFTPEDYFQVRAHMIGTGMIGGKACGMLLARKLIASRRPELYRKLEPHDSYYIGSDVFYAYIVHNNFWDIRVRQCRDEEYFSLADEFAGLLMKGEFSRDLREQFGRMLDYFGPNPIIVRSSSILEDGFGNAFAGKYESVFCCNTGSLEERLRELENAVRIVYASTMSRSALDYRMRRGLQHRDEQMALLVQRVSGSRYGHYFMPCAAGVGYSYSPYRFLESMDPTAGMLRLVMGLGTGAVDRTPGSYPRLVSMDMPGVTAASTVREKHQYSQKKVDVLNLESDELEHRDLLEIIPKLPPYLKKYLLEHDVEAEDVFRERGERRDILFASCEGLVQLKELMEMLRGSMQVIQEAYQYPVDIEYTINLSQTGEFVVNLLQCRPLQVEQDTVIVELPEEFPRESVVLEIQGASMGMSRWEEMDYVVFVDPKAYYEMPYNEKYQIASLIGKISWQFRGTDKNLTLMVPGRIGTTSPELGVPTTFADISSFRAIFEIADSRAGYQPELSYGSHIFQDLVEAGIFYGAVFENEKTRCYQPALLKGQENLLTGFCPGENAYEEIIQVYEVKKRGLRLYHDMKKGRAVLCFERR